MTQMFCLSTAFHNCSFNENNLILSFHSNEYKKDILFKLFFYEFTHA